MYAETLPVPYTPERRYLRAVSPFGLELKRARVAAGYSSQSKLAKASGVPQPTISRIENGTIIKVGQDTLEALLAVLSDLNVSLVATRTNPESLQRFLDSDLAKSLDLTEADHRDLHFVWYAPDEDPSPLDWLNYVRLRREVRAKKAAG